MAGLQLMNIVLRRVCLGLGCTLAGALLLGVLAAGAVWLLLPGLNDYKPQVEGFLSEMLGQEITIAALDAEWHGLGVRFRARGLRVAVADYPGSGMRFGEILLSYEPLSVFDPGRSFERLELKGATIEVARLADGRIRVGDTIVGKPQGIMRHLLQGSNLQVTDGTVIWRDALSPEDNLKVENVSIDIHTGGEGRRFRFTAAAPENLVQRFEGAGTYDPRSLESMAWTGALDVTLENLNLARIPAVLQERLPWQSHGELDTRLRARWSEGVLTRADAEITARRFVIPYAKDKTPLSARRFSSALSWRRSEQGWRLLFTEPEIVLDDTPVSVTRFGVRVHKGKRVYSARDADVRDLLGVLNRADIELPGSQALDALEPRGMFSRAVLTLSGPYLEAERWHFEGDFSGLGWQPQERYPGVQGLDGHLDVDGEHGELVLTSSGLELDAPGLLRQPVALSRFEAGVEWQQWGRDWVVDVADGALGNQDFSLSDVNLYARFPSDRGASPFVLGRVRIDRADIPRLPGYLPLKAMKPAQAAWLEQALAGGEISEGRVYLNGPVNELPFEDGGGELKVQARIADGVLNYHDQWPNLAAMHGEIRVENARLEADLERGTFMGSSIRRGQATSENFFHHERTLRVEGAIQARADDVLRFVRRGPLIENPPPADQRLRGRGDGVINLDMALPLADLKEGTRVMGDYVFEDLGVEVMDGVVFSDLAGKIEFTERSVSAAGVQGELMGGPVRADVTTVEPGQPLTFAINGSGETQVERLTPVLGPVLLSRVKGRAQWHGRFVGGPGTNRLNIQSSLAGVAITFPDPLWKPRDIERALDVTLDLDRDERRVYLDLEDSLSGELHYRRAGDRMALERGVLNLGGERPLPEQALALAVEGRSLDADRWIDEISSLAGARARLEDDGRDRDALFDHLRVLDVDVQRFRYLGQDLGALAVSAHSADGKRWTGRLDGPRLAGTAVMDFAGEPASYALDMTRMYWPRPANTTPRRGSHEPAPQPSEFAHLTVTADELRYGEMRLGQLALEAGPGETGWNIHRLSLQQPDMTLQATGRWSADHFDAHRTRLEFSAQTGDLGATMGKLGLADQVAKGEATLSGTVDWRGQPGDFHLSRLDGELTFKAEDGRFLKLEPGSGKLLGLFNVNTLARRFKLDFSDVFKEGLAFDRIEGEAGIIAGRLQTDGIFIAGPAALIELRGATSLVDETYDLKVMVGPQLGGNLSLAGAIANPAAGAMIFVLQRVFKKQMAKLIRYKYAVTGDWDEPEVEVIEKPASPDNANQMGRGQMGRGQMGGGQP